jgi:hypothetical protein
LRTYAFIRSISAAVGARFTAHDRRARGSEADVRRCVDRDALPAPACERLRDVVRAIAIDTDDHGRDALVQLRQRLATICGLEIGVAVCIDEAGRDVTARCIDGVARSHACRARITDERDALAAYADIRRHPRIAWRLIC